MVLRALKLGTPSIHSQVSEVLVLSGEVHPASPHRRAWHAMLVAVCEAALDRGFLPHTNAGRPGRPGYAIHPARRGNPT